jgi:hypothetical protein
MKYYFITALTGFQLMLGTLSVSIHAAFLCANGQYAGNSCVLCADGSFGQMDTMPCPVNAATGLGLPLVSSGWNPLMG